MKNLKLIANFPSTFTLNLVKLPADSDIGMNRGIYANVSSMAGLQTWLDVASNNLANASTTGYKADGLSFTDALTQQLYANAGAGPAIGSIGSGEVPNSEYTDFSQGPIQTTGNPLNAAIQDANGMFSVQTPNGVAYTRDGSFELSQDGTLVNESGYSVLDNTGHSIAVPNGDVQISPSGELSVRTANGVQHVAQIGVYSGSFSKLGSNLYSGTGTEALATPKLAPGALEGSNVNAIQAMTDLIKIGRLYALEQKAITQQDTSSNKLLQAVG